MTALTRRTVLKAAPALGAAAAVPAMAGSVDEQSQVMALFHEWKAHIEWSDGPEFSDAGDDVTEIQLITILGGRAIPPAASSGNRTWTPPETTDPPGGGGGGRSGRASSVRAVADDFDAAAEAARIFAEEQARALEQAEAGAEFTRDTVGGIASDLLRGVDAADAFANALGRVADRLISAGLDGLFTAGAGGGIFGAIGAAFGFSQGTANTGGRRGEPRGIVHGQEAVIPLPSGGRVPVQLQGGSASQQQVGGKVEIILGPGLEARMLDMAAQQSVSITQAGMGQVRKEVPGIVANSQMRRG